MESQSANTNLSAHKYCKRDLIEIVSIFPVTKKIQLYEIEDHKNGSKFVTDPVLNATVNCPWSLPLYSISDMNVVTLLPHMHVNTILHTFFIQHVYIMLPVNMKYNMVEIHYYYNEYLCFPYLFHYCIYFSLVS